MMGFTHNGLQTAQQAMRPRCGLKPSAEQQACTYTTGDVDLMAELAVARLSSISLCRYLFTLS